MSASFCRTHFNIFRWGQTWLPTPTQPISFRLLFPKNLVFLRPFNGLITCGQKTRPWSEVDIEVDKKLYTTFYEQWDLCSWQQTFETIVLPGHRGCLGDMKISQKIRTKDLHFGAPYILILYTEWTKGTSGRLEIDLFWDRESVTKVRLTSCTNQCGVRRNVRRKEGRGRKGVKVVGRRSRRVRTPVRAFPRNFLTRWPSPTWLWQQQKEYKVVLQRTFSDERLLTRSGRAKTRICGQRCFWRHYTRLLVARKSRI